MMRHRLVRKDFQGIPKIKSSLIIGLIFYDNCINGKANNNLLRDNGSVGIFKFFLVLSLLFPETNSFYLPQLHHIHLAL